MTGQPKISVLTSLYQSENFLKLFLAHIEEQSLFSELEFVLVINDASQEEQNLCLAAKERYPEQFQLLFVRPLESLGASWNRAWKEAKSELVAVWNVDDRRESDALERQWLAMQTNPDWQLCYGDYVRVPSYGAELGERRSTPPYSRGRFRRSFPQGGAFWVMRRELFKEIGFFDEQFQVGSDLDYSLRIAEAGFEMGKVQGLMGYFTDAKEGLSTRDDGRPSDIERTAIQLRYGIFDKVRSEFLPAAAKFKIDAIQSFDEWIAIDRLLPHLKERKARLQPLWRLGWLRNQSRKLLARLGLLKLIYRIQAKVIGREL